MLDWSISKLVQQQPEWSAESGYADEKKNAVGADFSSWRWSQWSFLWNNNIFLSLSSSWSMTIKQIYISFALKVWKQMFLIQIHIFFFWWLKYIVLITKMFALLYWIFILHYFIEYSYYITLLNIHIILLNEYSFYITLVYSYISGKKHLMDQ